MEILRKNRDKALGNGDKAKGKQEYDYYRKKFKNQEESWENKGNMVFFGKNSGKTHGNSEDYLGFFFRKKSEFFGFLNFSEIFKR